MYTRMYVTLNLDNAKVTTRKSIGGVTIKTKDITIILNRDTVSKIKRK